MALQNKQLVISDSDIDAALHHLNSLPHTVTATMPQPWAKQTFTDYMGTWYKALSMFFC
jgi:lipocalin